MPLIRSGGQSFLNLYDTPLSYTGKANNYVIVKATEDGLEFTPSGGGGTSSFSYDLIGSPLSIPTYQQMLVHQAITINDTLTINGKLVLLG